MSRKKMVRLAFLFLVAASFIAGLIPTGLASLLGLNATKIYFAPLNQSVELPPPWDTFYYSYPAVLSYNGYMLDLNVILIVDVRKGSPYGELAGDHSFAYDVALFMQPGSVRLLNISLTVPASEIEAAAKGSPLWMTVTTVAWFTSWFMGSIQIITPTIIRTVIPLHLLLAKEG
ncbi:MAG: hypothetical protein QXQ21_06055 [Candidatus Jordarchaeales archaeon]